jgi:hypothetical protein
MQTRIVANESPKRTPMETDAMWDTSHKAMAARFGARARQLIRDANDRRDDGSVKEAVRLAASYAFLADTSLRLEDRDAWTTEFRGERYLTPAGRAIVHTGSRSQAIH